MNKNITVTLTQAAEIIIAMDERLADINYSVLRVQGTIPNANPAQLIILNEELQALTLKRDAVQGVLNQLA